MTDPAADDRLIQLGMRVRAVYDRSRLQPSSPSSRDDDGVLWRLGSDGTTAIPDLSDRVTVFALLVIAEDWRGSDAATIYYRPDFAGVTLTDGVRSICTDGADLAEAVVCLLEAA